MNLDKIMNLRNDDLSLRYIENLLESYGTKDEIYYTLNYKKTIILNSLDKKDQNLLFLKKILEEDVSKYAVNLYTYLIELLIEKEDFNEALKYINIKKTILSIREYKYYFIDMLKYHDKRKDANRSRRIIHDLLGSDIDEEEQIFCYTLLAKYAIKRQDEKEYNNNLEILAKLYQDEADKSGLYDVLVMKINHDFEEQDYLKVISRANELLLNNNLLKIQQGQLANILIKSYIELNNYKNASKIETKFSKIINDVSDDLKKDFYKTCFELYNVLKNTTMSSLYQEKIKNLDDKVTVFEEVKPKNNNIEENRKLKKQIVTEDYFSDEKVLNTKVSNVKTLKKDAKQVAISQMYEKIRSILKETNSLDITSFREVFRITAINLCKNMPIDDIVVFYKFNNTFKGFHYKVQRVYDKTFDNKALENTINYFTYLDGNEKYIDDLSKNKLNQDIITNKPYDLDIKVLSLPIYNNKIAFGSISYLGKKRFIDLSMAYEIIKTINNILNNYLNFFIKKEEDEVKNQKMAFILDNMSSGIKEESEGLIYLNQTSQNILGINNESIFEKDFIEIIDSKDLTPYKNAKRNLINGENKSVEINYHIYKDKTKVRIKERMYLNFFDNKINIFSLIDNIDTIRIKEEALTRLAFTNYVSKLPSSVKLHKDLKDIINIKKFAVAIIDINEFNKFHGMYGLNFANEVLFNVAKLLEKKTNNLKEVNLYHLQADNFAILFTKSNDKRLIHSNLLKIFEEVAKDLEKLDSKMKISFSCGVYRNSSNLKTNNVEKILGYANDALFEAKSDDKSINNIIIYELGQTKERFINTQIINHIKEALDNNLIAIHYEPIIDLLNNNHYMYEVSPSLTNYLLDFNALSEAFEKKALKRQLGKYLINMTFLESKSYYTNTNELCNIIIPIYSSLFLDLEFIDYINGQIIQHDIKSDKIMIKLIDDILLDYNHAKNLTRLNVKFCSSNMNNFLLNINDSYLFDIKQYQTNNFTVLKNLASIGQIITYNVDNESLFNLCLTNNIRYIKGKYFDKKYNITDLIDLKNT